MAAGAYGKEDRMSAQRAYPQVITACAVLLLLAACPIPAPGTGPANAVAGSRTFPETGKTVSGRFLEYWQGHGSLAQLGYPISDQMQERSDINGKTYLVQYFERAVLELHPENQAPYDVLLSLLGVVEQTHRYPRGMPNPQPDVSPGSLLFVQTRKRLGGKFLAYWQAHGGLMQQGYPISDEFNERSELDGRTYRVQYFERALFELHPEHAGTQYEVLLAQLGTFQFRRKYPATTGATTVTPPTAATTPTTVPAATMTAPPGDAAAILRQRPLRLPSVHAGQPCPTTPWQSIGPNLPPALGDGPIYAVGFTFDQDGLLHLRPAQLSNGLYYEKVLWVSSAEYEGPALVRGGQIDGANELQFVQYDDPLRPDAWLDSRNSAGSPTGQPGWRSWPSYTVLAGAGCYAYQVDALPFTKLLVFKAVDTP
jgi:hypothetical protein